MAQNEYSPELNQSVLEAILRRIRERQAREVSAAQGIAARRGLAGGSFEGRRTGAAVTAGQQSAADAEIEFALANAARQREERLISEGRTYQTSERLGSEKFASGENLAQRLWGKEERLAMQGFQANQQELRNNWNALEAQKQRAFDEGQTAVAQQLQAQQNEIGRQFQAGESEKNRLFDAEQAALQRKADAMAGRRQDRGELVGAGANLLGMGLMSKFGGLFGAKGGADAGGAGGAVLPWGTIGAGAAGFGAGAYGGQKLGNAIFKSRKAEKRARKGATIGAGIGATAGSVVGGPIGGMIGGVAGGIGGQLYGGLTASKPAAEISRQWKKAFCFDPITPIEMADGSQEIIQRICLGDRIKDGGEVVSVRCSKTDDMIFNYKGVHLTGYHAVFENGSWIRVKDSSHAFALGPAGVVISLVTENHRIISNGVIFADEYETDSYETLDLDESLALLNEQERKVA